MEAMPQDLPVMIASQPMSAESLNLSRAERKLMPGPWYHNFSPLGLETPQRGGIYPANQKCKQAILFALIEEALRLCRKRGGSLRGVELFCADGFYGMHAMRLGAESVRGIDLDKKELARARLAAKILGWGEKTAFEREDAFKLKGEYDFCICAGGLYHLEDPARLLSELARKIHGPMVVQTVVSLARTSPDYFETPAPGWTWGSRFSTGRLQDMVAKAGWDILQSTENELTGNDRPEDRGSVYLLCLPASFAKDTTP